MESISEQISLTEALSEVRLTELPKEWEDKSVHWSSAIVRVRKNNLQINYVIAENDGEDNPLVIRDFGTSAKIVEILGIYPYRYLSDSYAPDLRNKSDILSYLSANGVDEAYVSQLLSTKKKDGCDKTDEEKKADKAIVKKMIVRISVKNQSDISDMKDRGLHKYNDFFKSSNGKRTESKVLV